jgi:hypothetical protein
MLGAYEVRYCCDEKFLFLLARIKNILKKTKCKISKIEDKIVEDYTVLCCKDCNKSNGSISVKTKMLTRIEYEYK